MSVLDLPLDASYNDVLVAGIAFNTVKSGRRRERVGIEPSHPVHSAHRPTTSGDALYDEASGPRSPHHASRNGYVSRDPVGEAVSLRVSMFVQVEQNVAANLAAVKAKHV